MSDVTQEEQDVLDTRRAALEAAGWEFRDGTPETKVLTAASAFWAVKHVAGHKITQGGETPDELCERCEHWDVTQLQLKPEFRLGGVA